MSARASNPVPPPPPPPDRNPEPLPKTPEDPEKGRVPPVTEPGKSEHPKQGRSVRARERPDIGLGDVPTKRLKPLRLCRRGCRRGSQSTQRADQAEMQRRLFTTAC